MRVLGEVVSASAKPIQDYRAIQVVVYDENGDMLGREYTNWDSFQMRQTSNVVGSFLAREILSRHISYNCLH